MIGCTLQCVCQLVTSLQQTWIKSDLLHSDVTRNRAYHRRGRVGYAAVAMATMIAWPSVQASLR